VAIKLRRYCLHKFDRDTGRRVDITAPEPRRVYWTKSGAYIEAARLNASMAATHLPWRYTVQPR
jgi:hypothetical protein